MCELADICKQRKQTGDGEKARESHRVARHALRPELLIDAPQDEEAIENRRHEKTESGLDGAVANEIIDKPRAKLARRLRQHKDR